MTGRSYIHRPRRSEERLFVVVDKCVYSGEERTSGLGGTPEWPGGVEV